MVGSYFSTGVSMRVYVWQQYGHVSVYAAETLGDLERLFNTVYGAINSLLGHADDNAESCKDAFALAKRLNRTDKMMRSINRLVEMGKGHESFEYNDFTVLEQPK
jgi:hypothetical protein